MILVRNTARRSLASTTARLAQPSCKSQTKHEHVLTLRVATKQISDTDHLSADFRSRECDPSNVLQGSAPTAVVQPCPGKQRNMCLTEV
jgi:hypothetical protein